MRRILPYHFCKLRAYGFFSFYQKVRMNDGVLCLDMEDSIDDPDKGRSRELKQLQRTAIIDLLKRLNLENERDRIGIRINSGHSEHFDEDLSAVNSLKNIHSIFLPKVEDPQEIQCLLENLTVKVDEVIPIVETWKAFDRIDEILSFPDIRFVRIIFGHCDFNLSKNCFPFFHQDSNEYWEWISFLDRKARTAGKKLINSPVLRIDDERFFLWTLNKLSEYPSVEGQATLSMKQTEWCSRAEDSSSKESRKWKKGRVSEFDAATSIVENFRIYRLDGKSFAVDDNRMVISPQEYFAAGKYLEKFHDGRRMLIVGGCLPIQHNIPNDRLFHRTIVDLLGGKGVKMDTAIIRYETLSRCLGRIIAATKIVPCDILLLSLRTEPLMRISKVLYKFVDSRGDMKRSVNFPFFKILNAEIHDPLSARFLDAAREKKKKESKWRRFLIESNCFLGAFIGNKNFALRKYEELVRSINAFCMANGMTLLILGPSTRPFSKFENWLAKQINERFTKLARELGITYVDVLGTHDDSGNYLFFENGLHVSQAGHDRIGKKIFEKMVEVMS
jgi:HpcH/HpaI aldolase/citrate lyase family